MYNVSWFRSTPAVLMKTDVIIGSAPRDVHASLPELRALGFQLGDTVSRTFFVFSYIHLKT